MDSLINRFLDYVSYGTASDYFTDERPSTKGQKIFARYIAKECERIGFTKVTLSEEGYVYCYLKGKGKASKKSVGFIAHMDTSPDYNGNGVKPRIVKYEGGEIALNCLMTLSPERFPSLSSYVGHDLIVTDGTTLLGADDKAGIAEILTAVGYIFKNENEYPDIYVAFTPDEEIGRGMDGFDMSYFKPDFAYTVDGGVVGELEYESFNAARASISVKGESVHPGYAKGIMKNAALITSELIEMLPKCQTPAETDGYDGYFHVNSVKATVADGEMVIAIRDFNRQGLEKRKKTLVGLIETLNHSHGDRIKIDIKDEYYNMRDIISDNMEVVEIADKAYRAAGIEPSVKPIRGGTDGSRLSFMGIPCPNIFTGGCNFHGPYEYISVQSMQKAVLAIINIVKLAPTNYA